MFRLIVLKKYILSLTEHQAYLRVMDIKEKDLFEVDEVVQRLRPFCNVDLRHDVNDESDLFQPIKSLSINLIIF